MTDFIKLRLITDDNRDVILSRSQISSVEDDISGEGSEITMCNGSYFKVEGSAEHILMHYIGTKQA